MKHLVSILFTWLCFSLNQVVAVGDESAIISLGSVQVNISNRSVVATGWVNQVKGPIEYFACGPGGKTHESILVLNVRAADLHAALLSIGLEAGTPGPHLGEGPISGPLVDVLVQWEGVEPISLCSLAQDAGSGAVAPDEGFVFTGSGYEDGYYLGDQEESLTAAFWDPWAVLNYADPKAGTNDDTLVVFEAAVPSLQTPVSVEIRKRNDAPKLLIAKPD